MISVVTAVCFVLKVERLLVGILGGGRRNRLGMVGEEGGVRLWHEFGRIAPQP